MLITLCTLAWPSVGGGLHGSSTTLLYTLPLLLAKDVSATVSSDDAFEALRDPIAEA